MTETTVGTHLSDELLERYILGHSSKESACEFEDHLLLCEGCRVRLNEADQYLRVMSTAAAELRTKPVESKWKWKGLSLAWLLSMPKPVWAGVMAMIALAIGVGTYPQVERVSAAQNVVLEASRGLENRLLSHAKPGRLILSFDSTEIASMPEYHVQLVSAGGDVAWKGTVAGANGMMHVPVAKHIPAGNYWIRIYGPDGTDLLREYGLELK